MDKTHCKKWIKVSLLVTILVAVLAMPAFAENYRIPNAYWEFYDEGNIRAEWDEPNDSTGYCVQLFKNGTDDSDKIGSRVNTGKEYVDFTSTIGNKGKGTYYFSVYSSKGGTDTLVYSNGFEVGTEELSAIKSYLSKKSKTSGSGLPYAISQPVPGSGPVTEGWKKSTIGDHWMYQQANGAYFTKTFKDIGGHTYYFDRDGYAVKGWYALDNKWYYFEQIGNSTYPQCALYKNTTTPDGFTVNAKGIWVVDGKEQKASASKKTTTAITECKITVGEKKAKEGEFYKPSGGSGTKSKVSNVSFSVPFESWTPGITVSVTMKLTANNGYYFSEACKFTIQKYTITSNTGSNSERTITFDYKPVYVLTTPKNLQFTDGDGILSWTPVPQAAGYKVKISEKYGSIKTVDVTTSRIHIYNYIDTFRNTVSVEVSAYGSNSSYQASGAAKIKDLENYILESSGQGTLETGVNGTVTYTEANGTKPTGWKCLAGAWYYFVNGTAKTEGWFQDPSDGNWYYINKHCQMATGYVTPKGESKTYFLNDGSVPGKPYGAWVENK